ncbi:MAG: hypothetical protein AAGK77_10130 [Pseudomonadota bacterium]
MKKIFAAACFGFALTACDAPGEQPQAPASDAAVLTQDVPRPVVLNRGFTSKRTGWKDKIFFMPDKDYGAFTYLAFSRLAIAASVECGVPLDGLYLDAAEAAGRRALFQNKAVRQAKARAAIEAFG